MSPTLLQEVRDLAVQMVAARSRRLAAPAAEMDFHARGGAAVDAALGTDGGAGSGDGCAALGELDPVSTALAALHAIGK